MLKKFNELNSTTYLSASAKAKDLNQDSRSNNLTNYVFHEFIGKEINDSKVKKIYFRKVNNHSYLYIIVDSMALYYNVESDELLKVPTNTNTETPSYPTLKDRKSAVILSRIILKANPDSKYKSVNNFTIEQYK